MASTAIAAPLDWERVEAAGPGPFVTRQTFRHPDGARVTWTSRDQRKRHSVLDTKRGSTWWAPGAIGWWIGALFAVGSVCFALGAAPGYVGLVGDEADAVTFFVGSILFTSAALLQYLEVANLLPERTNPDRPDPGTPDESRFHPPGVMPGEA